MAVDLSAFLQTATASFYGTLAGTSATWMRLTAAEVVQGTTYTEAIGWGIAPLTQRSTSAKSAFSVGSDSSTTTPLSYDGNDTITYQDLDEKPGYLESRAAILATAAMNNISTAFWAAWAAVESTTHPLSGETIIGYQGGGAASACYCADDFTVYPLNSVASFSHSNLYGTSFSADAITAMLAARQEYLDLSGQSLVGDQSPELPFVIVPAAYQQLAEDIRAQRGLIYDGSGLQSGSFQERTSGVVVPPGVASDTSWGLIYRRRLVDGRTNQVRYIAPIRPVIASLPKIKVDEIVGYPGISLSVEVRYAIHTSWMVMYDLQRSSP